MKKGQVMSEDMYNHIVANVHRLKEYDLDTGVITTVKGSHGAIDNGYLRIKLYKRAVMVHQIIAVLVYGKDCVGKQINHKNGNKLDNSKTNLEVVTLQENIAHAIENGLFENSFKKGRSKPHIKFTEEDIQNILADKEHTYKELGKMYGVHEQTIYWVKKKYK